MVREVERSTVKANGKKRGEGERTKTDDFPTNRRKPAVQCNATQCNTRLMKHVHPSLHPPQRGGPKRACLASNAVVATRRGGFRGGLGSRGSYKCATKAGERAAAGRRGGKRRRTYNQNISRNQNALPKAVCPRGVRNAPSPKE